MKKYSSLLIQELVSDVPVDPVHVRELADSIMSKGQLAPVIIREETKEVVDGFHRIAAMKELGFNQVECVLTPCDDEGFWDFRIIQASLHKNVTFARAIDWMDKVFQLSPWTGRYKNVHGLFQQVSQKTAPKEVTEWAERKAKVWGLAAATIEGWLEIKKNLVPELLEDAKRGGVAPATHYREIAHSLPSRPELQKPMLEKAIKEELTQSQIRAVAQALRHAENEEEVRTILAQPISLTEKLTSSYTDIVEEQAREKARQEILENPAFLKQAAGRFAEMKRKEREEARLKTRQAPLPMPLTEADLVHKVIIGDAREVLQLLPPSSVDLVVTSPPYFGLKDYQHDLGVDTHLLNHYLDDLGSVLRECHRTLKDGTFLCIVVGQYTSAAFSYFIPGHVAVLLEDIGFRYKREHIWVKPLGVQGIWNRGTTSFLFEPFPRNTMINIHHEHILIFQKGEKSTVFPGRDPLTEEEVKEYCWSVWELYVSPIKDHPAPFPDTIPERLIKMYSYEGEVVLDPFLGSGTTMKMAKALKRRSIGVEVSPEYLDLIQQSAGAADVIRFDEGKMPDFSYLAAGL